MSESAPGEEEEKLKDDDNDSDDAMADAEANAKMKLRNPTTRFCCLLAIFCRCWTWVQPCWWADATNEMSQMTVKLSTDIYFWDLCFIYLDSEFGRMNNILVDGVFKVSNIPVQVRLHRDAYTASRYIESQTNTKHGQRWGWRESAD